MGHHSLLQGIFPTQGLNLSLLHGKVDSLPLSQLRSPLSVTVARFVALGTETRSLFVTKAREELPEHRVAKKTKDEPVLALE